MKSKALERISKRMVKDPPMEMISMRMPRHMIDELKEIAAARGFAGYQGLIRYYISQGARKDLEELDQPRLDNIARALKAQGVPKKVIDQAFQAA
jgi:Arc/MetJ-type ribon-helix-helix transcriptional regulator